MNFNCLTIRSRNPMYYIDDQGQIVELSNTYDNEEVIEIKRGGGIIKVPINKKITILQQLGVFLFKTKDDALLFSKMLFNNDFDQIVKNVENQGKVKDNIMVISSGVTKSGLYSIEAYDQELLGRKEGYCALTKNNKRYHISQVIPNSNEDKVIVEYINRNSKFDYMNFATNKVLFELLYQNGKTYITSYTISSQSVGKGFQFITDLNNYRVFDGIFRAKLYQKEWIKYGEEHHFRMERAYIEANEKRQKLKEIKKETTKKVFNILWGFVWNYKSQILGKGLDMLKKMKDGKSSNPIETKIMDMIDKDEINIF